LPDDKSEGNVRSRILLVVAVITTAFGACTSSGGNTRTVEVDAATDDFAGSFYGFFPRDVTVNPGMTVKFHQTWTGAANTVTMGSIEQDLLEPEMLPIISKTTESENAEDEGGPEAGAAVEQFFGTLPFFFGENGPNPAASQPCYLRSGLPEDGKACQKRTQPAFDDKFSYYNSGFIPFLGDQGNTFEVKIAQNTKPGAYFYYCNLHGAQMSGEIHVTRSDDIPSQGDVNRAGKRQLEKYIKPRAAELARERAGKGDFKGNLSGSGVEPNSGVMAQVNEFTPRTVQAKVGEPVTWTFINVHTISFNVPPYFPLMRIARSGRVVENVQASQPAGGWPGRPEPPNFDGPPGPSVDVDAGKFDGGGGLKSSGEQWQSGDTYTVTFTKAGTYPMACLIHPGMVGKVVVT
jgi:plastocyanin